MCQIEITRQQPGATGNIHFSFQAIQKNQGQVADVLASGPHAQAALVPATPWLDKTVPPQPVIAWEESEGPRDSLRIRLPGGKQPRLWAVQIFRDGKWRLQVVPGSRHQVSIDGAEPLERIAVTAISRTGVAGPVAILGVANK